MFYSEVGHKLAQLRNEQGMTQTKLAELTGISRATINAFENGRVSDIGLRKVIKLFDILGYELTTKPRSRFPTFEELINEP